MATDACPASVSNNCPPSNRRLADSASSCENLDESPLRWSCPSVARSSGVEGRSPLEWMTTPSSKAREPRTSSDSVNRSTSKARSAVSMGNAAAPCASSDATSDGSENASGIRRATSVNCATAQTAPLELRSWASDNSNNRSFAASPVTNVCLDSDSANHPTTRPP